MLLEDLNDSIEFNQNFEADQNENLRLEELKMTVDVEIRQQKF